ncbi:MAG: acylneuraminate cytidylyltransferase family protein [Peptostreptococcaceae bacterium]|jgi:CMP-N,N'-diacetyllegionaminic acid synthase|nr:acylneuraminate cytidylyltransferase family protein [Peptostreptococcaceae bacterium]
MYKNKKIVAIIPARKGSKGIVNKNIRLLGGIPLIEHSIKQARKIKIIDKIIISTDSEEICNIAKKYNIEVKNLRPSELSNDTAVLYDVLKYEINNYNLIKDNYEVLVLLQPTSPLRQSYMIEDALIDFIDQKQISAVSVSEVQEHPIFMRTINENNNLVKVLATDSTVRRQELPKYYKVNGMIYINKIKDILNSYVSFNDNLTPIIIPNDFDTDIDTLDDLELAEKKLKKICLKY